MKVELELTEEEARLVESLLREPLSNLVSVVHNRKMEEAVKQVARQKLETLSGFIAKWQYVVVKFRQTEEGSKTSVDLEGLDK